MNKFASAIGWLTKTADNVPESQRRRANLLAWLLLVLLLLTSLSLILVLILDPLTNLRSQAYIGLILGLLTLIALAYGLNRTGYHNTAAGLIVACSLLGPWGSLVADPNLLDKDLVPLTYVALSLFLSATLLPPSVTISLAGLQLAVLGYLAGLDPSNGDVNWPSLLAFVFSTSVLSILSTVVSQRDLQQIDRQSKALAESNAELQTNAIKLSTLFEVLPVGVSMLNTQHQIVDANPALQQILKISNEGLAAGAYTSRKYIHPDGTPIQPDEFASTQALEKQKPVLDVETGVITETGKTIWTSVSAVPLSINDLAAVIVTTDITQRKHAEEELRQLGRKDEEALGLAHMGRWEFDLATAQFIFNDQYYTLHGTTVEAAGGYRMSAEQFVSKYVHPDDGNIVGGAIQYAMEKNDPDLLIERETRILRCSGSFEDVTQQIAA